MEVKKAGLYKTRDGRMAQVYGFDDLGGNEVRAEGFFQETRAMGWWKPETGEFDWAGKPHPESDIVGEWTPNDSLLAPETLAISNGTECSTTKDGTK